MSVPTNDDRGPRRDHTTTDDEAHEHEAAGADLGDEGEAHDSDDDDDEGAAPDDEGEEPTLVDESQFDDASDDDDDDDVPMHFSAVAHPEPDEALPPPPESSEPPEIPLDLIDADALWVVRRLQAKGFEAYLTGGCVRDLLLGRTPKDFDVATAAHPNQVKSVFRNCRLVGRRFRLAHVFFPSGKVIETATFRANPIDELDDLPSDLLVERDNVFGTVEQDARRRDLTINGLFYDPLKGKVLDFVAGRADLEARLIRTIGTPEVRFQEDPVRIIRAIKFATRLGFAIEEQTLSGMRAAVGGLVRCAPARLQEELLRLLTSGHAAASMELCADVGVHAAILPELESALELALEPRPVVVALPAAIEATEPLALPEPPNEPSAEAAREPPAPVAVVETRTVSLPTPTERRARAKKLLEALDAARGRDLDVTSAIAFAVLLAPAWEAMKPSTTSFDTWLNDTLQAWSERLRLTRHDKERVPQILDGQDELVPSRRRGQSGRSVTHRPSFRESLLLYTLRLWAAGEPLDEVGLWKVMAAHANAGYKQPRLSERAPRQRAATHVGGDRGGGRRRERGGRRRRR
ncbi:MAG: polynucleotide adenylyltransferase PcnB [Deltaproteobacteria bacterium]|nr:polynucleotide adenylyltransferase PcnB [Deltaproteobacteria bacterium]